MINECMIRGKGAGHGSMREERRGEMGERTERENE